MGEQCGSQIADRGYREEVPPEVQVAEAQGAPAVEPEKHREREEDQFGQGRFDGERDRGYVPPSGWRLAAEEKTYFECVTNLAEAEISQAPEVSQGRHRQAVEEGWEDTRDPRRRARGVRVKAVDTEDHK